MGQHPSYPRVFGTFIRNSLIRDMTFRGNFLLDTVASTSWVFMNMGFYILLLSGRVMGLFYWCNREVLEGRRTAAH